MTRREKGFLGKQLRILNALIIREIYTRFGRDNIGFAWVVVEPTLFCLGVVVMWTLFIGGKAHVEIPLTEFLITGYMPLLMYRHSVMRLLRCMQANAELLYHRDVTIFLLYMARLVMEILGTMAAFIIVTALFVIWGLASPPHDVAMILGGFAIYALFSVAISIVVGAASERSEVVEKIWGPISYISIPLSGTFYMVYWLPSEARELLVYVPMVTGVEIIRGGYFGPGVPIYYDVFWAVTISLLLLLLGLFLLRDARRFVEVQ